MDPSEEGSRAVFADETVVAQLEHAARYHQPEGLLEMQAAGVAFDEIWNAHRSKPWVHHWLDRRGLDEKIPKGLSGGSSQETPGAIWQSLSLDMNALDLSTERTPRALHRALKLKDSGLVGFLLSMGADPNAKSPSEGSAWSYIPSFDWSVEAVVLRRQLLAAGTRFDQPIGSGGFPLSGASRPKDLSQTWLMWWVGALTPSSGPHGFRFLEDLSRRYGRGPWQRHAAGSKRHAQDLLAQRSSKVPGLAPMLQGIHEALAAHDQQALNAAVPKASIGPSSRRGARL